MNSEKKHEVTQLDFHFMALAIREAERGLYTAHPNPRVGCILVKDGQIVSRGYHRLTGTGHAEANALSSAQADIRGATAYCTLEPCSFAGRTPSCAEALVSAGVSRVVCGMEDPHPNNRGKGFEILRKAGIEVVNGILETSNRQLNPGHIRKYESAMPYTRLKLAMSLDGKTALANGESKWITGPDARKDVQRLRARSSAIVTGVQTVIDDDPLMSVRASELDFEDAKLASEVERRVVVVDSTLRTPKHSQLLQNTSTVLACCDDISDTKRDEYKQYPLMLLPEDGNGRVNLKSLLAKLAADDCNEVLFECGASLSASLIRAELVDEIIVYIAPKLLGASARSLVDLSIEKMTDSFELEFSDQRQVGADIRMTLTRKV